VTFVPLQQIHVYNFRLYQVLIMYSFIIVLIMIIYYKVLYNIL
jgi:hypothetical protein